MSTPSVAREGGAVVQPHLHAIVALDLTHSTSGLGTVLAVQAIPRAILMLFGGAITDRFRACTVMLVSDFLQSLVVLALAILAFSGTLALWHLLVYAALSGTIFAFFLPAASTVVPELVPDDQVMAAVFCLGYFGATFVGLPALAKLVFNAGDPGVGFVLGHRGLAA